jgi:cyclophilin family peptidyl-prolyl cis-trans isomerase
MATKSRSSLSVRTWIHRLLRKSIATELGNPSGVSSDVKRTIRFEPLESRQLMAADFFEAASKPYGESTDTSLYSDNSFMLAATSSRPIASQSGEGEGTSQAEGQPDDDLVAFAQALTDAGVLFFGAAWCPACTEQKRLFEDGERVLPFVEVTNPDRSPNSIATSENITAYPTWEFQSGNRVTGVQTLAELSTLSGIAIPQSSTPTAATIGDQNVRIGSPLHVPVDAYDPNGNPLTITAVSSDPALVTAEVLTGNRSLEMDIEGFGSMVFELFESDAPRPTGRVIELAEAGFYDRSNTNAVPFHRVVNNFVIQGGDPTGTGSGGSSLGDFDDQFNVDLQHNQTGVLSFAKSTDDTNDSQFFITEGPQRGLDFQHSVFGHLVEGDANREAISNTAVNSSDRPDNEIIISSFNVFSDTENGLIRLKSANGQTGTATITVTISDTEGNSTQQTFVATVVADTDTFGNSINSNPFLDDVTAPITATPGLATQLQLSSQDVENDPVVYDATKVNASDPISLTVDSSTGLVTITPEASASGTYEFTVGVRPPSGGGNDPFDIQRLSVMVSGNAPTSINLVDASDSGSSNTDNLTNLGALTFSVAGTESGATVELIVNNTVVGSAVATGATTTITTSNIAALGAGTYGVSARQTSNSQTSGDSPSLQITFDNIDPVALDTSIFPSRINSGQNLSIDLTHPEENAGLAYGLTNAPNGMTIDAVSGVLTWTPTDAQIGANGFDITLTDAAGNVQTQAISIDVSEEARMAITTQFVDVNGNVVTSGNIGDIFRLQVFVQDVRNTTEDLGVFAAYTDIEFDASLVSPNGTDPIGHGTTFTSGQTGTISAGLVDELGGFAGSLTPTGGDVLLLAEVTFRADATGNAIFNLNQVENNNNEYLFFSPTDAVPGTAVSFVNATLPIGLNYTVANDTLSVDEDSQANSLDVLANDIVDAGSGAILTIQAVEGLTSGGNATVASDGLSVIYTPAADFNGEEQFTYRVTNQSGVTATATATITVQSINDPPISRDDSFQLAENSVENFLTVLSNDDDGVDNGETLTITSVQTPPQGGQARVGNSDTVIIYTPPNGFVGTDTFTYTISDGRGGTSTSTITVTVGNVVPPPTAVADSFTIQEDAAQASFDVLANDIPSETGETLSLGTVTASSGTASVSTDGLQLNYTPAANFAGTATVTYQLLGSLGGLTTGTATFVVTPVNDAPTANDDALNAVSSQVTTLDVLANDSSVDAGETLTIASIVQPTAGNGTVAIAADNRSLTYAAPNSDFTGTVTFTYTLGDGSGLTDTATVTLTVQNFATRIISGSVNNPAGMDMSGVNLRLVGTDANGTAVDQIISVTGSTFATSPILPGNYVIQVPQSPFLIGEDSTIPIVSAITDGDVDVGSVSFGEMDARYIDIRDFLGQTLGRGLSVAIQADDTDEFILPFGDWQNAQDLDASLANSGSTLNLVGTDQSSNAINVNVPTNDINLVELRATVNQSQLFRVARSIATGSTSSTTSTASTSLSATSNGSAANSQFNPGLNTNGALSSDRALDSGPVAEGEFDAETAAVVASQALATDSGLNPAGRLAERLRMSKTGDRLTAMNNEAVEMTRQKSAGPITKADAVDAAMRDVVKQPRISKSITDSLASDPGDSSALRSRIQRAFGSSSQFFRRG